MNRLMVGLRRRALTFGLAATHGPRIILLNGEGEVKVSLAPAPMSEAEEALARARADYAETMARWPEIDRQASEVDALLVERGFMTADEALARGVARLEAAADRAVRASARTGDLS